MLGSFKADATNFIANGNVIVKSLIVNDTRVTTNEEVSDDGTGNKRLTGNNIFI